MYWLASMNGWSSSQRGCMGGRQLSTICPKLHTVSLSGCFRLTDDAIEVLARNCQGACVGR